MQILRIDIDVLLGGEGQGCFHSSELWYTFHSLDRSWRPKQEKDYEIADVMNKAWGPYNTNENPFMHRYGNI